MILTRLGIQGIRNLQSVDIRPDPALNLFVGPNASGKTSLLEGIHLLAYARSFRTRSAESLIGHGCQSLVVHGRVTDPGSGACHRLGLERSASNIRLRIDGEDVRQSSQAAQFLPVQIFTPESNRLIELGPKQRRQFIDWGLFHVEPTFHLAWSEYSRAVRQRNTALRNGLSDREVSIWDEIIVERGEEITRLRKAYVSALEPAILEHARTLLGFEPRFNYQRGWRRDLDLSGALQEALARDRMRGSTTVGPHRADLVCLHGSDPVQERFSRGQQKMLVFAMRLAQIAHLNREKGKRSVILVDDLAAELDPGRRTRILDIIRDSGAQTFITATEEGLVNDSGWPSSKLFHVEHGKITEVV